MSGMTEMDRLLDSITAAEDAIMHDAQGYLSGARRAFLSVKVEHIEMQSEIDRHHRDFRAIRTLLDEIEFAWKDADEPGVPTTIEAATLKKIREIVG